MVVYSAGQYQYMGYLLALSNCRPRAGTVPWEVCSLRTPLEWAKWARYLEAQDYTAYIVQGLQESFALVSIISDTNAGGRNRTWCQPGRNRRW